MRKDLIDENWTMYKLLVYQFQQIFPKITPSYSDIKLS